MKRSKFIERSKRNSLTVNPSDRSMPFCKICHKAGLSTEEYTSHWTKTEPGPNGTVVCPYILSSKCGYCREIGHWTKYCPKLEDRNSWHKKSRSEEILYKMVNENDLKVENFGSNDSLYMLDVPETFRPCSPDYPPDDMLTPPPVAEKKSWADIARSEKKNTIVKHSAIGIPFNYAEFKSSFAKRDIRHDWSDDDYWSGEQGTYGSPATPPF